MSSVARLALAIYATDPPIPLLAYCGCADSILGVHFFTHLPSPQSPLILSWACQTFWLNVGKSSWLGHSLAESVQGKGPFPLACVLIIVSSPLGLGEGRELVAFFSLQNCCCRGWVGWPLLPKLGQEHSAPPAVALHCFPFGHPWARHSVFVTGTHCSIDLSGNCGSAAHLEIRS